jgi:lipopolysaccharide/colanic/teichoic acid biosynthesis glycosyltransferase
MVAVEKERFNINTLDKFNKKKIIIAGNNYKFVELDKLKEYNIVYINSLEEIKNYNNIEYIVLNGVATTPIINKPNIKVVTIEEFLEQKLQKLYLQQDIKVRAYNKLEYLQKRAVDILVSVPVAILGWPIVLYSMYRIKKESPDGPILFKQKRVGKYGKEFVCYKFRSMIPDAENGKPQFASKDDPRVFKWGAFMRKTRIDELPQFWNVLKGEMHLIGPRPERRYWIDQFKEGIPSYCKRHLVAPGITGWAQVNYPYGANIEDTKQKLMYDLYYIKNWSIKLEVKIVFKTIAVVLNRKGH